MEALSNTLGDPRGRWLLSGRHFEAETEFAVSVLDQGRVANRRIDRTFVDMDGVRWVVDYKTSVHEGGALDAFLDRERQRYADQLEGYARAMAGLEQRPIRLGLYFPLLTAWREWRFDDA